MTTSRSRFIYLAIAVVAGLLMPVQSRINGALGSELDNPFATAAVSFGVGFLALLAFSLLVPAARRGLARMPKALATRQFPWWYLAAGAVGGFVVVSQSAAVPVIGVALFTVCVVTGQSIGSMLIDRIGFGPAAPRKINAGRLVGVVLTIAGVVWAVSPRLGTSSQVSALVLPMVFTLVVGMLMGFQTAANGVQTQVYGTPVTATLMNFTVGLAVLLVIFAVRLPFSGPLGGFPHQWWYYTGGLLGCLYIGAAAFLVKHLGVLVTGLCTIGGQLVGSLLLDAFFPSPGTHIGFATVAGTVLTLLAVALASVSGSKSQAVAAGK